MTGAPGSVWEYSDPAYAHLSLIFDHVAGQPMHCFVQDRIFDPIGIRQASFSMIGGAGHIGPNTCGHVGLVISARDLARFGLLACRGGVWVGRQVLPADWQAQATCCATPLKPDYGLGWWVNTGQVHWPGLPADMFAAKGHNTNLCYVIPSLDLVAVKVGSGPTRWNEGDFIGEIVRAAL